jgi:hypothetical protein
MSHGTMTFMASFSQGKKNKRSSKVNNSQSLKTPSLSLNHWAIHKKEQGNEQAEEDVQEQPVKHNLMLVLVISVSNK